MIGLIFGETNLPTEILKKIKKKRYKYLIIDLTKKNNYKKDKFAYVASIGQFGKIINILKNNKCKKVLFAGVVKKPKLSKLKLDFKGIYYIPRIIKGYKLGDAAILKEIIKILKNEKIETLSSLNFNKELTLKKGIYSKTRPSKKDIIDIKKSIIALKNIGKYNSTQGVVTRNGKVIAMERKDGTDKMLRKCAAKKNKTNGVLVKFPKEGQDLRIDLPTVGIKTFYQCKKANLKGVVLKSNQNVLILQTKIKCLLP